MAGAITTTTTPAPTPLCDPGWLRNAFTGVCTTQCPSGAWCVQETAYACPAGTASAALGAWSNATCAPCGAGSYAPTAASAACFTCPIGAYCPSAGMSAPTPCPPHTVSGAGSLDLAQCACMPNYLCTYTRSVRLQLAFNSSRTLADLQADQTTIHSIVSSVVQAMGLLGVPGVSATFDGFVLAS